MTENELIYIIGYLFGYRLAVILLGGLSIYLGYRLFLRALIPAQAAGQGASGEFTGKLGSAELSLKTSAPGTFFAAFGAFIVTIVLSAGPPEFIRSASLTNSNSVSATTEGSPDPGTILRGEDDDQEFATGAAIETVIARARERSAVLARSAEDEDKAAALDLQARLEFASGMATEAFRTQQRAVKLAGGRREYQRRLAAYKAGAD